MTNLPEYAVRNRQAWTKWASDYVEAGRKAWQSPTIYWGIWGIPEAEVGAFGDQSRIAGKDTIELGCGTAYFSAWMAKLGARPVGIDVTPAQLETARSFQKEFGIEFPLIEGSAETVPLPNASFDIAFSEYGASIWCDPEKWIAEAARLLRPGGELIFMRNSSLSILCQPSVGPAEDRLMRSHFAEMQIRYQDGEGEVEFQPTHGDIVRILRKNSFQLERLLELQAPEGGSTRYDFMTLEWARKWPCEEIWCASKIR